jgi:hypothetical protein
VWQPGHISRILSAVAGRTIIPLGRALLRGSSDLPGGSNAPSQYALRSSGTPSLFGLAPCGVCPARVITAAAVRSYRTFSPLPEPCGPGGMFSVALSVELPPLRGGCPPGRYPAHCSTEFGLSSVSRQRSSGPAAYLLIIGQALRRSSRHPPACTSFGANKNTYTSSATPIRSGITPTK